MRVSAMRRGKGGGRAGGHADPSRKDGRVELNGSPENLLAM